MVLNNIKNRRKDSGFTIVELLVVIVVIAILAAITIVAYSGITARANATKAISNAESTQKVGEAYNADNGYYPATLGAFATGSTSTKLPTGITIVASSATAATEQTNLTGGSGPTVNISYACVGTANATTCPANPVGGRLGYYNQSTSQVVYVYIGNANSGSAYAYPTT